MTAIKTIVLSIAILVTVDSFGQSYINGKIIDEKLQPFGRALVINKTINETVMSDINGLYQIKCNKGDTITFECIGVTAEKRIILDLDSKINVILMNKFVNCLGSPWTQRQYRKADKRINRIYKGLYKHADKKGIWKN